MSVNDGPSLTAAAAELSSGNVMNAKPGRTPLFFALAGNNSILLAFGKSFWISSSTTCSGSWPT